VKTLVFILVLGNLLFYAFSAGYFGHPDNPDGGRIEQQVAPERMRLVSRGEAPPVKPAEVPPAAPVSAEAEAAAGPRTCLRWDQLSAEKARQLSSKIGDKFAAYALTKHTVAGESNGWWVFIPPLPGKAEADKKAGELRQLGITDYFIIADDGPHRFAISLGVFSSEKGGQDRLGELKAKGVKSARVSPRTSKEPTITLEASGPLGDKEALLKTVAEILPKGQAQSCK